MQDSGIKSSHASTWQLGDVFVGISSGSYQVYDNAGVYKETISDGVGGYTTGCVFNSTLDKLYTTNFSNTKVIVYDVTHPHNILQTIDTNAINSGGHSESVVFDAAGNLYVGHPDGNDDILKYDKNGNYLQSFDVAVEDRGSDWMDLSSDQQTLFYTSEGKRILRYDIVTDVQLTDFSSDIEASPAYALRLLPPGDGSGGLLVASTTDIRRLDGSGNVIQTYDATGEDSWFALNLDPNGTSFWSGNYNTSNFYRFNIATGAIEVGPINTGTGGSTLFGICVAGELTVSSGENITLSPLSATNPINTEHTVTATVRDNLGNVVEGVLVTFSVISGPHAGTNGNGTTNSNGKATFTYLGTIEGVDIIEASFINTGSQTVTSNDVEKEWEDTNAVELLYFRAINTENGVLLAWETASEIDNAGFNIYRTTGEGEDYVKINKMLIPAKGDATTGATYRYLDIPNSKGVYSYKLEDLDSNGVSTMHGPETITVDKRANSPALRYKIPSNN